MAKDRSSKMMWGKFWFINLVAFGIIAMYVGVCVVSLVTGNSLELFNRELWAMTPFQFAFVFSCFYLYGEGKLLHKLKMAEMIKESGTIEEFKVLHGASKDDVKIPFINKGDN